MATNEIYGSALLGEIIKRLDLPPGAYEKAEERYLDFGKWFSRDDSLIQQYDPHIFPQGSFRLGTAIKPLNEEEDFDLDLVCKLRRGYSKINNTQSDLKDIVGRELESYRLARGIQRPLQSKHRCWCLEYKDTLGFHMDIIPCIPAEEAKIMVIMEAMRRFSESDEALSQEASRLTVSITDDRSHTYMIRSDDWPISNPEGYALWFKTRMDKGTKMTIMERARVDDIPMYAKKSVLQRVVQILKRHRDVFFNQDQAQDNKPASIIISTLAARAYQGEQSILQAMIKTLSDMDKYISTGNNGEPRIPNPVDPRENFADKWSMPQYEQLRLAEHFQSWLAQARADFNRILESDDSSRVSAIIGSQMGISLDRDLVESFMAEAGKTEYAQSGRGPTYHKPSSPPPKPWGNM